MITRRFHASRESARLVSAQAPNQLRPRIAWMCLMLTVQRHLILFYPSLAQTKATPLPGANTCSPLKYRQHFFFFFHYTTKIIEVSCDRDCLITSLQANFTISFPSAALLSQGLRQRVGHCLFNSLREVMERSLRSWCSQRLSTERAI